MGNWLHPMCGGIAGLAAKLATFPMDVAKKRLQIHGLHLYKQGIVPARCPGLWPSLKEMWHHEGTYHNSCLSPPRPPLTPSF